MLLAISTRLDEVRKRITAAAARAGRSPDDIVLIAVSKTHSIERIAEAYAAGQRHFGENRVQELLEKAGASAEMELHWHLIGHLQSNKARKAVAVQPYLHVIDSVDLLRRVDRAAAEQDVRVQALVQVDLAGETSKSGAPPAALAELFDAAQQCAATAVEGLMLIPPFADDPEVTRPWFRRLVDEQQRLLASGVPAVLLQQLSMGMSHDFEVAIEEGATMVRVGTAIFGQR